MCTFCPSYTQLQGDGLFQIDWDGDGDADDVHGDADDVHSDADDVDGDDNCIDDN